MPNLKDSLKTTLELLNQNFKELKTESDNNQPNNNILALYKTMQETKKKFNTDYKIVKNSFQQDKTEINEIKKINEIRNNVREIMGKATEILIEKDMEKFIKEIEEAKGTPEAEINDKLDKFKKSHAMSTMSTNTAIVIYNKLNSNESDEILEKSKVDKELFDRIAMLKEKKEKTELFDRMKEIESSKDSLSLFMQESQNLDSPSIFRDIMTSVIDFDFDFDFKKFLNLQKWQTITIQPLKNNEYRLQIVNPRSPVPLLSSIPSVHPNLSNDKDPKKKTKDVLKNVLSNTVELIANHFINYENINSYIVSKNSDGVWKFKKESYLEFTDLTLNKNNIQKDFDGNYDNLNKELEEVTNKYKVADDMYILEKDFKKNKKSTDLEYLEKINIKTKPGSTVLKIK